MRKWYLSITVLGLGGLGAFVLSDWGRNGLRSIIERFRHAPDRLAEWNEGAQLELDRIQAALNQIAESLSPREEMGH
jgi:hypothetical protein